MGIYLAEPVDVVLKHEFIQKCKSKNESLVKGDVLRVTAESFPQLLEVLQADTKKRYRTYLSECVRLQYHANACVLEQTESFKFK